MVDPATFFKAFGIFSLGIALVGGFVYWVVVAIKKFMPNIKYAIKYSIFKRKHDPEIVANLFEDIQNGVDEDEMYKKMILKFNKPQEADEIRYIYRQLKKIYMKGGKKNE